MIIHFLVDIRFYHAVFEQRRRVCEIDCAFAFVFASCNQFDRYDSFQFTLFHYDNEFVCIDVCFHMLFFSIRMMQIEILYDDVFLLEFLL